MTERRQHAGFSLESSKALGVRRKSGRQDLDRDIASEPCVMCAIHLAHSAGAKRRNDLVVSEPTAGGQPRRRGTDRTHRAECVPQLRQQGLGSSRPLYGEGRAGAVRREQRFHFPAQRFIPRHSSRQERGSIRRLLFDRSFKQMFDAQPSIIGHRRSGEATFTGVLRGTFLV